MGDLELFKFIFSEAGAWSALAILLIIYTNKRNEQRETKYQDTIEKNQEVISKLANAFEEMKDMKNDIKDIKINLVNINRDIK